MSEENVALVKRGYEAFAKGDLDFIREMSTPDIVWHTPGYAPFQADYRSPDGVIEYFAKLAELSGGTFKDEPEVFLDDEERVVVIDHVTGARDGKTLDTHMIHTFGFRDGKIVETSTYAAEPKRNEEFWS